jgi:hypothetical protein
MVCAEHIIVSEIVLDALDGVCAEHTIISEIVLDAPDGTPRWQGSSW